MGRTAPTTLIARTPLITHVHTRAPPLMTTACHGRLGVAVTEEISGDLFDLLIGLGDFGEFKSLMLSYKEQVAGELAGRSPSSASGG